MSFVRAVPAEGGAALVAKGFTLPAPPVAQRGTARSRRPPGDGGRPLRARARGRAGPHHQRHHRSARADGEAVEALGDAVLVHGRAGEDVVAFKMDPHRPPEMGDRLPVQVEVNRLRVFDAETGARL